MRCCRASLCEPRLRALLPLRIRKTTGRSGEFARVDRVLTGQSEIGIGSIALSGSVLCLRLFQDYERYEPEVAPIGSGVESSLCISVLVADQE